MPPAPIRVLRDLTRARSTITRARTKEIQRLEKLLEDTGIKLSAVASNIVGVSGRAMLEALIAGERDPAVLADLAKRQMRAKIPALTEALRGRFTDHHAFMVRLYLDRIDAHAADIARLDARIEEAMQPFRPVRELLMSIPGWSQVVADVFIAETGADMSVFPTAAHLASWAGVVPGCDESAGLGQIGGHPSRQPASQSRPRCRGPVGGAHQRHLLRRPLPAHRLPRRAAQSRRSKTRGMSIARMTALVAIEHKMLTDAWHMLTNGAFYHDPGPDYYIRHHPGRTKAKAIKQLETLGYKVTLEPLTEVA